MRVITRFIVTLAIFTGVVPLLFAQQDTQLYNDTFVSFSYPSTWTLCSDCPPTANHVTVGTSQAVADANAFDVFRPNDVQIVVMKSAAQFYSQTLQVPFERDATPSDNLLAFLPLETTIDTVTFEDERIAGVARLVDTATNGATHIWMVSYGNGEASVVIVTGTSAAVEAQAETVFDVIASLHLAELLTLANTPLDEMFISTDGTFTLSYPTNWHINEAANGLIFMSTSTAALAVPEFADLRRNELVAIVYPALSMIPNYPEEELGYESPETAVLFFQNLGEALNYVTPTGIESVTLGDYDGLVVASSSQSANHDRLIVALNIGESTFTMIIFTAYERLADVRPLIEAIAASVIVMQ